MIRGSEWHNPQAGQAASLTFARRTLSVYPGTSPPCPSQRLVASLAHKSRFAVPGYAQWLIGLVIHHFTMLACGDEVGLWGETLPAWAWASESLSNNVTGLVSLHLIFSVIVDDLPICSFNCDTAQLLVVYCLLCGVTIPSFCCLQRSPRAS
jgi:hypothetical protein